MTSITYEVDEVTTEDVTMEYTKPAEPEHAILVNVDQDVMDPESQTKMVQRPTTKQTSPKPSSSSFNYVTILEIVTGLAVILGLLFGILKAAGALDKKDGTPTQQDDFSKDGGDQDSNGILDVCAFQQPFDIRADGSLLLRQFINIEDSTVTVELEYNDIGWLGFAFSESATMVPNTAVIALPDANSVQKFSLESRSLAGVNPSESSSQTLTDTSIIQENGRTIMKFTKKLVDGNEVTVNKGENRFNWAIGSSNNLSIHKFKGSATLVFTQCLKKTENDPAPPIAAPSAPLPSTTRPTVAPVLSATDSPVAAPAAAQTINPTKRPITAAPSDTPVKAPTSAPAGYGGVPTATWTGTWSKYGNRRSCSIDKCPSANWTSGNATTWGYGCTCTNGLNSCYWEGSATTVEWFTQVKLLSTDTPNVWQLQATGTNLKLGEGYDFASGSDCFDDPLRGGFRVDLSGTGLQFHENATVSVSGYSPAMRMTTASGVVGAWRQYQATAEYVMSIPTGSQWVEVACGGWPASCTGDLLVTLA
jgi:DOMON domain